MARRQKQRNQTAMDRSDRRAERRRQVQDDYGYSYEEETAITLDSLRRSKKYLLIAIVFLVLSILSVVGYMFMYSNSIIANRNNCWLHQQQVEQLASSYVTSQGLGSLPAYIETVPGYEKMEMKCPSGGSYTWNPITGEYYCSEHGHWPPGFNEAQSVSQGTRTQYVENDN